MVTSLVFGNLDLWFAMSLPISSVFTFWLAGAYIRLGDEERRLMHLVPAPAVRLMNSHDLESIMLTLEMSLSTFGYVPFLELLVRRCLWLTDWPRDPFPTV
jgi:hypothetical protein